MKSILKPCPFCGGEAELHCDLDIYAVICSKCGAWGATVDDWHEGDNAAKDAIAAWNRRAQPENEPIVRCGECIHFEPYDGEEYKGDCNELVGLDSCMYENDYCIYGERKPERSNLDA